MFGVILQGYLLMFFTIMHLTVLVCDEICVFPVQLMNILPQTLLAFSENLLTLLNIDVLTAQMIGQFMLLGDIFIAILIILKIFGCIIKRFILMFATIILSIIALQRIHVI